MKKFYLIIVVCFLPSAFSYSQNLIPNGDFEQGFDTTTDQFLYTVDSNCVILTDTVVGCNYWAIDTIVSTPLRFVHGSPFFYNCYDNIIAHSGIGYVGFNGGDGAYTTLINHLQIGHKYKLEYYVCLDSTWFTRFMQEGGISPETWVRFTFNSGGNIFNSPSFTYTGFGAWEKYDTVFTAQANSTEFDFHGGDNQSPLPIYIDDISLQENFEAIKENSFNNITPTIVLNTENNLLYVTFNNNLLNTIVIHNSLGQCIFNSIIKENKAEIPMAKQSSGIYYITIFSNNSSFTKIILLTKT